MVVNQDLGPGAGEKKVQCILVSKEASKCSEHLKELEDQAWIIVFGAWDAKNFAWQKIA